MSMMSTAKSKAHRVQREMASLGRRAGKETHELAEAAMERGSDLAHEAAEQLQHAGRVVRKHPVISSAVVATALIAIGGYLLARRR